MGQANADMENLQAVAEKLLEAYWDGSLKHNVLEATSGGSRDTMCRTPSLATGSATKETDYSRRT